jgi:acyl-CoA synthetase (AMP-forming)/AMP-acid ligase II
MQSLSRTSSTWSHQLSRISCGRREAAFAVADEETGERLALAIRAAATTADITYIDVVEHLTGGGLAKWKLPEQIVVWEGTYPRTASGKIIRRQLTDESRHLRTIYAPRIAGG